MRKNKISLLGCLGLLIMVSLTACGSFDAVVAYERVEDTWGDWVHGIGALEGKTHTETGWTEDCDNRYENTRLVKKALRDRYEYSECRVISFNESTGEYVVEITHWIHARRKVNGKLQMSPFTITGNDAIPKIPLVNSHRGDRWDNQDEYFLATATFISASGEFSIASNSKDNYNRWLNNPNNYCAGLNAKGQIIEIVPVENMPDNECFKEGQDE